MAERSWVVTPEDLAKGDLVKPGWYNAEIVKYEDGEAGEDAKNPGSATSKFYFKALNPETGKYFEPYRYFSETAWGFAKTFFAAMNFPKDGENYKVSSSLFRQTIGHKVDIYIVRGKTNKGNEFNEVKDFRPYSG